jgi:hypothetical protein
MMLPSLSFFLVDMARDLNRELSIHAFDGDFHVASKQEVLDLFDIFQSFRVRKADAQTFRRRGESQQGSYLCPLAAQ